MAYTLPYGNDEVVVIDTPGLADTRGTAADDANVNAILQRAETLGSINAIVFVVNGGNTRKSVAMKTVFAKLRGSLPDSVLDNILVIASNVTGAPTLDVEELFRSYGIALPSAKSGGRVFPMNNLFFNISPGELAAISADDPDRCGTRRTTSEPGTGACSLWAG